MPIVTPLVEEQLKENIVQGPVGQSVVRADGREKVRGEPIYYSDLKLPNMLHGRVLRSPHPHARILAIDTSRAAALPGVAAVATAADIPGVKAIGRAKDQYILCEDKVRFIGDGVALVAAETPEIAAQAIALIDVQYEVLPAVFSPKEALLPDAPRIHGPKDNILRHFKLRKGDTDDPFRNCDVIVENTYHTQTTEHAYLEVEGAVANPDADGTITIWVCAQIPFLTRNNVAAMLNVPPEQVRLINTNAGGGFGGKSDDMASDISCRAALLAHLTKRPVKLVHSREESIICSSKRHAAVIEYKSGAAKDGRLQAVEVRVYLNKGAYSSVGGHRPPASGLTTKTGYHAAGPYVIPNVKIDVFNVYTNIPAGGAFRGFGVPQVAFAHEAQMDELAQRLGMDPVEIRLLNGLEVGSRTASNQLLENSVGYKECIRQAAQMSGWKNYRAQKPPHQAGPIKRGMGISTFMFACSPASWPEYANATMEIGSSGHILVRTGIAEIGQGARTVFAQIAAQALEIPLEHVRCTPHGDTAVDQDSMQTTSSRGTICAGNAVIAAAKQARQTLIEMAAHKMRVAPELIVKHYDKFRRLDTREELPLREVLQHALNCGRRLLGAGWWCTPEPQIDPETMQGNPYHVLAYGAQVIEVEVNTDTGNVEVKRIVAAQDVGKAINPQQVAAQIEGGVIMGLGFAMTEEVVFDQGRVLNPSLAAFLIPTAADVPEIVPLMVEDPYPNGPYGAIANAIYDAVGVRVRQLPITAERVWKALQEKAQTVAAG
jgi:CO/xanthine dehydrogenase Mo-binding subunit